MHTDPFHDKKVEEIYDVFTTPENGFPNWPDERMQTGFTGSNRYATLRQGLAYLKFMENDGAFNGDWRGLDYACGWGRFASLLLKYGTATQLDLVDAWPATVSVINTLGYKNKIGLVSPMLKENEIENELYDFVISFSLFTHLNEAPFKHNLKMLAKSLAPTGRLYFTVRHENFIDHMVDQNMFSEDATSLRNEMEDNSGFLFRDPGVDPTELATFGHSVVTKEFLDNIDKENLSFRYLGAHSPLQVMYVMERRESKVPRKHPEESMAV